MQVASHVLTEQTCSLIENLVGSLSDSLSSLNIRNSAYKLNGDLRALTLVYGSEVSLQMSDDFLPMLEQLLTKTKDARKAVDAEEVADKGKDSLLVEVRKKIGLRYGQYAQTG